ncbi:Ornithine carbamoyltransferase [Planctomycetes bacterium Poly30]|uniref:Ornithine carbamoyltransferase n=1 Tax=Saltatorellus ferox TaxID=2528018 RepID=A0A518EYQ7_9BACT|nr:Ornithine carbamoyltransferase [Planctomycetes bacterium Poly30]
MANATANSPSTHSLSSKDLVSISDLSVAELRQVLHVAQEIKSRPLDFSNLLRGKRLSMVFEKESLRTRFTFDIGMQDLGGSATFLDLSNQPRMGARESVRDMAMNLERWTHGIVARTYRHRTVVELAQSASIPVINGLSDLVHPCQALADTMTLMERWGDVAGRRIAFIGDGNNTCHSLMAACTKLGANMVVCTPEGYEPDAEIERAAVASAAETGGSYTLVNDPRDAAKGAHAIYTDVWASMGQEDETEERAAIFSEYSISDEIMELTDDGVFMHCLPAHRGHEVSRSVIDGPQSIVFDIAENRLHAQKAVLALLLAPGFSL